MSLSECNFYPKAIIFQNQFLSYLIPINIPDFRHQRKAQGTIRQCQQPTNQTKQNKVKKPKHPKNNNKNSSMKLTVYT